MQMQKYASDWSHLHLTGWPFQTVPDETFTRVWADRTKVKEQMDRLIWRWTRVDRSTLHLMWADLGAGKTHTLKYIRQHFLNHPELGILPVYAVMPKQMRSFLDVYQAIMAGLDLDSFAEMFAHAYRNAGGRKAVVRDIFPYIPDACSALRVMQSESERDRVLTTDWLKGTRGLTRRHLDTLGVNRYVRTTDDTVGILSGLIRLVQLTGKYRRVLIMLDECQRIGRFKLSIGQDMNTGLQTWYDSNPNNLTLVLSFGSGEERFVRHLLSPELQSREDHLSISMPLLTRQEALDFVKDLFEYFHTSGAPSCWSPFTQDIVESVIGQVTTHNGVTPRVLMKAFDSLLTEADFQIGTRGEFKVSTVEVTQILEKALRELTEEAEELSS